MGNQKQRSKRHCWQRCVSALLALVMVATMFVSQPVSTLAATDDGQPWVDHSIQENVKGAQESAPTDDFYWAVNRDWLSTAKIKPGESYTREFSVVSEEAKKDAQNLLTDASLKGHDAQLIQTLYQDFMDWDARNKAGMKPLRATVKAINQISSMKELSDFICSSKDTPALISIESGVSLKDSDWYVTCLDDEGFLLDDAAEYANRTELGDLYYKAMKKRAVTLLKRLGYSAKEARQMFDRVIAFEGKLAKAAYTSEDLMDPGYAKRSCNEMNDRQVIRLTKNFPMKAYIKGMGYGKSKTFNISNPGYIKKADSLYTKKNLNNIKEYMLIRYLLENIESLDKKAYDVAIETGNMLTGADGKKSYKEYGYLTVADILPDALQRVYLEQHNAVEKQKKILDLCEKIAGEYRRMLEENTWLSEATKAKAVEKLDALKLNAVIPDDLEDYSSLKLKGRSLYEDYERIADYYYEQDIARINQKVNKDIWDVNTLEANAFYDPQSNSINILLGMLGGEFYQDDMSEEELYSGIGMIIGHEISHAFDPTHSQFDAKGNYANWWTDEDRAAFDARAQKLIDYFNSITAFDGKKVSGKNVQGEAIADLTSLQCMLRLAKEKKDFDYDQFFRHYASIWRNYTTVQYESYRMKQDPHPLAYLRVNAMVQQFEEFYQTYHVTSGDQMYLAPEKRLAVW